MLAPTLRSASPHNVPLPSLAQSLVQGGLLNETDAHAWQRQAEQQQLGLIATLIAHQAVDAQSLARHLANSLHYPLVDLQRIDPYTLPTGLIDTVLCQMHRVLVVSEHSGRLVIATADPSDAEATATIQFASQRAIDWVVAPYDQIATRASMPPHANAAPPPRTTSTARPVRGRDDTTASDHAAIEDAPAVKFLHTMLQDAVRLRASDLHFEPYENRYRVRFRIDGVLHDMGMPPAAAQSHLAARIKIISRLDIAEKRLPQDGRVKLSLQEGSSVDLRISTLPTLFGEKVVVRVLETHSAHIDWATQGFHPEQQRLISEAIARPHGMILVTGPTGSGKTVCLYSCLHQLNRASTNISTVEDPAEIYLEGVNQVNINEKAGLDFATVLRALLRQDPDVIMVGEIRDAETADIAIKAAQTGHLVLSTLHTNDAPAALTRLRNMGVPAFHIASGVRLITAQRLIRRLCPHCKVLDPMPTSALQAAGAWVDTAAPMWKVYQPKGCSHCTQGYLGRVGIYQVMPISPAMQQIILRDGSELELAQQAAQEGVITLRQAGLQQVAQGMTSLEEVLSATTA